MPLVRIFRFLARKFVQVGTIHVFLKSGAVIKIPVNKEGNFDCNPSAGTYSVKGMLIDGFDIDPRDVEAVVVK